jgi:hypothetical protein
MEILHDLENKMGTLTIIDWSCMQDISAIISGNRMNGWE